jgi:hypothetical protein
MTADELGIVATLFPVSAQGLPQVGIDFPLTGGQIADATPEEVRSTLNIVLLCFKDLYEQCDPITARYDARLRSPGVFRRSPQTCMHHAIHLVLQ